MKKEKNQSISIFLILLLLVFSYSQVAFSNNGIEESGFFGQHMGEGKVIELLMNISKFAHINWGKSKTIVLDIDLSSKEQQIEKNVPFQIGSNTQIEIQIQIKSDEFFNKLDKWLSYEVELNNLWVGFNPLTSNMGKIKLFSREPGINDGVVKVIFDLEGAREGNWWELEAKKYKDTILKFTILALD